jgi:hypothetical protein
VCGVEGGEERGLWVLDIAMQGHRFQ